MSIYFEAEKEEKKLCTNLKEEVRQILTNAWSMYICLTYEILLKIFKTTISLVHQNLNNFIIIINAD